MRRRVVSDRGSVTLLFVVVVVASLTAVGLVIDGGAKLQAIVAAQSTAESAARAGAQRIDLAALQEGRGGTTLDRASAAAAARAYLAAAGLPGEVSADARSVTVTVTSTRPAIFLPIIGITDIAATRTATADVTVRD